MSKKHLLIDKSTDELLEDLEGDDTEEETVASVDDMYIDNPALVFLKTYNIKSGDIPIHKGNLYKIYKKTTMQPVTHKRFIASVKEFVASDVNDFHINQSLNVIYKLAEAAVKRVTTQRIVMSRYIIKRHEQFIKEMNIEAGEDIYISLTSLYYFYQKWTYDTNKKLTSYNNFLRLLPIYLNDPIHITKDKHYGITKGFYEKVTKEDIEKAKAWSKSFKPPKSR